MPAESSMMRVRTPVTHVVFDVDGLLLNTEDVHAKAFQTVVGQYGKTYTWEIQLQVMGQKALEAAKCICGALELPISPQQLLDQSAEIWNKLFPTAELMPGAERLVRHLHRRGVPLALASGSGKQAFDIKTSGHQEFFALFGHAVLASTDPDVKHGKPAPDVYQVAAERFKDPPAGPELVLTFEDAPNGVVSARAAGMPCVMVPDPRMPEQRTRQATLVLPSLEQFRPEEFGLPPFDD